MTDNTSSRSASALKNLSQSIMGTGDVVEGLPPDLPLTALTIDGDLPADLHGHVFVISPVGNPHSPYGQGEPLFNGYGRVYRFDFNKQADQTAAGESYFQAKLMKPPSLWVDRLLHDRRDRFGPMEKFTVLFQNFGLGRVSPVIGSADQLNTAFLPFKFPSDPHDRLLVTWDIGRPFELDTKNLDLLTPIGKLDDWQLTTFDYNKPFVNVFASAHPVFDGITQEDIYLVTHTDQVLASLGKFLGNGIKPDQVFANGRNRLRQSLDDFAEFLDEQGDNIPDLPGPMDDLLRRLLSQPKERLLEKAHQEAEDRPFWHFFLTDDEDEKDLDDMELGADNNPEKRSLLAQLKAKLSAIPFIDDLDDDDDDEQFPEHLDPPSEFSTHVIRWRGDHDIKKWKVIISEQGERKPLVVTQTTHQVGLTADYVVLMDTAFKMNPIAMFNELLIKKTSAVERFLRKAFDKMQMPRTEIFVIPRSALTEDATEADAVKVVIPREAAHFIVDYDNPGQKITLHLAHNCATDPAEWVRAYDRPILDINHDPFVGMLTASTDINYVARYEIDANSGEIIDEVMIGNERTWGMALYTVPGSYTGLDNCVFPQTYKDIFWVSWGVTELHMDFVLDLYKDYPHRRYSIDEVLQISQEDRPETRSCLFHLQAGSGEDFRIKTFYEFPAKHAVSSPQFIPRQPSRPDTNPQTDGYLFCTVIYDRPEKGQSTGHEIWLFDAADLPAGPIAKLCAPELEFGFTLHSAWLSQVYARDRHSLSHRIPVRDDYERRVEATCKKQNEKYAPEIRAVFDEMYRLFDEN
ncbi:MAG: carotenoid oxygenase family protein [Cyanobacteria bacterium P01_H01_bin.15]